MIWIGAIVANCRIERLVRREGLWETYLARDISSAEPRVCKVLRGSPDAPDLVAAVRARCIAVHPCLPSIHDLVVVDDTLFLIVDEPRGPSLRELLMVPIRWRRSLDYVVAAASALVALRAAGAADLDLDTSRITVESPRQLWLVGDVRPARPGEPPFAGLAHLCATLLEQEPEHARIPRALTDFVERMAREDLPSSVVISTLLALRTGETTGRNRPSSRTRILAIGLGVGLGLLVGAMVIALAGG